jgi:hypothetical protein
MQAEIDTARLLQIGDPPRPARKAAAGDRRGDGAPAMTSRIKGVSGTSC